jgi:hypothetical protein
VRHPCSALGRLGDKAGDGVGFGDVDGGLPETSTTVDPARFGMKRWAGGGIIRSSVAAKYQLGLVFHAGWLILPSSASTPQGTCELAMNSARAESTSAANKAANFALSRSR